MADTTHTMTAGPSPDSPDSNRRDFLLIATGAFAAIGTAGAIWPFVSQMNPDASALALSSVEVDTNDVEQGQAITVMWRGKPVAIRYRTEKEMKEAQAVSVGELRDGMARNGNLDPAAAATDANRSVPGKEEWLIMVKVCTHLGCIPLGEEGLYGGWFCPCHGSQYDTAGRIRQGPAPENMAIPPYKYLDDTIVRIG